MSDLQIIGTIDDQVASNFKRQLFGKSGPLRVVLDSEGGNLFSALKMADALESYRGRKTLSIQGACFSAASFLAMSFDEVEMSSNSLFMLHSPYLENATGTANELASSADLLRMLEQKMIRAYSQRMQRSEHEVSVMLDRETFLDAQQAVAMGLADRVVGGRQMAVAACGKRPSALRRRALVSAANRRHEVATSKPVLQQAQEAWGEAVASFRAKGLSGVDAVRAANKQHPQLREILVLAANPHRRQIH